MSKKSMAVRRAEQLETSAAARKRYRLRAMALELAAAAGHEEALSAAKVYYAFLAKGRLAGTEQHARQIALRAATDAAQVRRISGDGQTSPESIVVRAADVLAFLVGAA